MPYIKKLLKESLNMELSFNINGDEGPSFGASFKSADISAGIKVKKITVNDGPNYVTEFVVKHNDEILIPK